MLTENLLKHATLTEGDVLEVWYRGNPHQLRVTKILPDTCGTLIDTGLKLFSFLSILFSINAIHNP